MKELKNGDKAPDFTLIGDDGKKFSLNDFRGKKLILYFYPKDNTSGCTAQACSFRDNIKMFQKKNAFIIGISKDNIESHKKFRTKYNLPFNLLSDSDGYVIEKFGVWKEKTLYGKKYFGIERTTFIIDENGIIKDIFRKVNVKNHIEEVLSRI